MYFYFLGLWKISLWFSLVSGGVSTDIFTCFTKDKRTLLLQALLISLCSTTWISSCIYYHSFAQCQVDLLWPMQWPFLYGFELQKPSVLKCWYWCNFWAENGLANCLGEKAFQTNTCTEKDWNTAECLEIRKSERSGAKWTWQKFRYCTLCVACVLAQDRIVICVLARQKHVN